MDEDKQGDMKPADLFAFVEDDRFALVDSKLTELYDICRQQAEQRGPKGRYWALMATKIEEASMCAERAQRQPG